MLIKEQKYNFGDVLIQPEDGNINSRQEIDLTIEIESNKEYMKGWKPFSVMSANMDTITDTKMAFELLKRNWIAVLHKYVSIEEITHLFNKIEKHNKKIKEFNDRQINESDKDYIIDLRNLFISRGTSKRDMSKLQERLEKEPRIKSVCIDVANGHREVVLEYAKELKDTICKDKILMVGNIASASTAIKYRERGVDILKRGIGPGCFIGSSEVLTKKGLKKIKDIEVGEEVLTHTNTYKKVIGKEVYEEKDKLISINGIKSTVSHEYYVINKKDSNNVNEDNLKEYAFWVQAQDLKKGEHLLVKYEK